MQAEILDEDQWTLLYNLKTLRRIFVDETSWILYSGQTAVALNKASYSVCVCVWG